ncbi:MAG TPA: hypothetical protein VKZ63_11140, partial [Kofleriaceae bacterium]|nr:hypothetical protein [Kofleriaceae bacterium]
GRARWLAGEGFRAAEWDEASEIAAGVVRYGLVAWEADDGSAAVSAAVGELGGVTLGHGSIVDGYASGLDVDHGHLGAQVRAARGALAFEALVDDVIAPRIGGARMSWRAAERVELGAQLAGDRAAPEMAMDGAPGSAMVAAAALDAALLAGGEEDRARGALYADLVGLIGLGAGAHLGARGELAIGDGGARASARGELRAGSGGYLPGWIGPLYERDRLQMEGAGAGAGDMTGAGQLEVARSGGLGGFGGLGELAIDAPGAGSARVSYAARRGVSDLVAAHLAAPYRERVQAGLWAAARLSGARPDAMALAAELRVRLPHSLFARAEAAHLFREEEGRPVVPIWIAQVAVGTVLGE